MPDSPNIELPSILSANWEEARNSRECRYRKDLRSLSVMEAIQQFVQLMEFVEKFPHGGNMKKLRQYETDQLVKWKMRIDRLPKRGSG